MKNICWMIWIASLLLTVFFLGACVACTSKSENGFSFTILMCIMLAVNIISLCVDNYLNNKNKKKQE